jgi:hypothetical protein
LTIEPVRDCLERGVLLLREISMCRGGAQASEHLGSRQRIGEGDARMVCHDALGCEKWPRFASGHAEFKPESVRFKERLDKSCFERDIW